MEKWHEQRGREVISSVSILALVLTAPFSNPLAARISIFESQLHISNHLLKGFFDFLLFSWHSHNWLCDSRISRMRMQLLLQCTDVRTYMNNTSCFYPRYFKIQWNSLCLWKCPFSIIYGQQPTCLWVNETTAREHNLVNN